jgi:hypothetical protein
VYGNFTIVARFFPGSADQVNTSTAFIGLDTNSNSASITMGFHGAGWLKGDGTGPHQYQLGVYAHNRDPKYKRINTTHSVSSGPRSSWSGDSTAASWSGIRMRHTSRSKRCSCGFTQEAVIALTWPWVLRSMRHSSPSRTLLSRWGSSPTIRR